MSWTPEQLINLAQRAASKLTGSSESLCSVLEQMDADGADNEMLFCKTLDRLAFECTCCNNWFEQVENVNRFNDKQWKCRECAEGDDDD